MACSRYSPSRSQQRAPPSPCTQGEGRGEGSGENIGRCEAAPRGVPPPAPTDRFYGSDTNRAIGHIPSQRAWIGNAAAYWQEGGLRTTPPSLPQVVFRCARLLLVPAENAGVQNARVNAAGAAEKVDPVLNELIEVWVGQSSRRKRNRKAELLPEPSGDAAIKRNFVPRQPQGLQQIPRLLRPDPLKGRVEVPRCPSLCLKRLLIPQPLKLRFACRPRLALDAGKVAADLPRDLRPEPQSRSPQYSLCAGSKLLVAFAKRKPKGERLTLDETLYGRTGVCPLNRRKQAGDKNPPELRAPNRRLRRGQVASDTSLDHRRPSPRRDDVADTPNVSFVEVPLEAHAVDWSTGQAGCPAAQAAPSASEIGRRLSRKRGDARPTASRPPSSPPAPSPAPGR